MAAEREVGWHGDLPVLDRELDGGPVGEDEQGIGQPSDGDVLGAADDHGVELAGGAVVTVGLEDLDDGAQGRLGRLVVVPLDVPVRRLDPQGTGPVAHCVRAAPAVDGGPAHGPSTTTDATTIKPVTTLRAGKAGARRPAPEMTLDRTRNRSSTIRQP